MSKAWMMVGVLVVAAALTGCASNTGNYVFNQASLDTYRNPVADQYKVMSFNLRTMTFIDAHNHWNHRKHLVARTIQKFGPDILGTQECKLSQARYLQNQLKGYQFIGAGRNNGKASGEMCGLFFRTDRFIKLDQGHFWLSETPDKPGSKSWGSSYRRMVTWAKLPATRRHAPGDLRL